ncbi:MAG: extracellular protein [Bacteroidetes bacterium HLUCCA01]|nr:MAG: extracellular protein [Bacteroidetes bacterium HLUCCA01]
MKHHINHHPGAETAPQLPYLSTGAVSGPHKPVHPCPMKSGPSRPYVRRETPFRSYTLLKRTLLTLLLVLLAGDLLASSILVGRANVKIRTDIDRSDYVMPNGMQFQEVYNLQASYATTPDLAFTRATTLGGDGITQVGKTAIDADGNLYVTGGFTGTLSYGGVTLESSAGYDFFLAKLNPEGEVLWYRVARGSETIDDAFSLDGGLALAIDQLGQAYVGGAFVKQLTFLDETGAPLTTLSDGRDDDLINLEPFVAKYDRDGQLLWAEGGNSGSPAAENSLHIGINTVNSIIIDREGYPYAAGGFAGTNLFGEEVSVNGESDFFVVSLDKDGSSPFWADVIGTPDWDYAKSISVDSLGYLNILGVVGEGRMDLTDSEQYWDNDTGSDDTFVISYDINGEWYFVGFLGAGDNIVGNSVASAPDGSIYVSGFFGGFASFDGSSLSASSIGERDGYLVKYDLNGELEWVQQFGYGLATADVVLVDLNEDVIVLGRYWESVIFDIYSDEPVILSTESESNIFMAKFDADGNFIWARNVEGSGAESRDFVYDEETRPFGTNPLDIVASYREGVEITLTGDFDGSLQLDDIALSANGNRLVFMGVMPAGESVDLHDEGLGLPGAVTLMPNYPNPFNPFTTLAFALPEAGEVQLEVFSMTGRRVGTLAKGLYAAGEHRVSWDASGLASGTYVYRLQANGITQTRKMTLIK